MPWWIIYVFDLFIVFMAFWLSVLLRFNFNILLSQSAIQTNQVFIVEGIFLVSFFIFKPYLGILRHSTTKDISLVIFAISAGSGTIFVASLISRLLFHSLFIPYSITIIHFAIVSFILINSRLFIKTIYYKLQQRNKMQTNIMIFGAGELGQVTCNALTKDENLNTNMIGFIDDNKSLQNKRTGGYNIYSLNKAINKIIPQNNVEEIIFAIDKSKIKISRKREIIDLCLENKILVKEIPNVHNWLNNQLDIRKIKKITIEDLLGRDSIKLNTEKIENELKNAVILVTGAAGSIGSEIVRQLMTFKTKKVILLDQAETPLFNLQNELISKYAASNFEIVICDVSNQHRMKQVFDLYKPEIVFNAAAYKHVPMMEENPYEAINVNVKGTKIIADLCVKNNVKKMVMISTDKAVNPTNVMGASKRLCEVYIQSLSQKKGIKTKFITTRFGNVLGSNGSVVPIFKKQIEEGGPVTVTHQSITRYFMTIPEACQLVLEAATMGNGGEIFVFDMGQPIKIIDLAKKMISLSGAEPQLDIKIKITGLRPGEKLHEELLAKEENLLPTHNEKILIGNNVKFDFNKINSAILDLISSLDDLSDEELVMKMKMILPEFISQNSKFCINNVQNAFYN